MDRPSLPPIAPEPSKPSSEEPAAKGAPELSESSSDSSDYSDDSEEDESGAIRWLGTVGREIFTLKIIRMKNFCGVKFSQFRLIREIF